MKNIKIRDRISKFDGYSDYNTVFPEKRYIESDRKRKLDNYYKPLKRKKNAT